MCVCPALADTMYSALLLFALQTGQGLGVDEADTVSPLLGWWNCVRNCSFSGIHSSSTH